MNRKRFLLVVIAVAPRRLALLAAALMLVTAFGLPERVYLVVMLVLLGLAAVLYVASLPWLATTGE